MPTSAWSDIILLFVDVHFRATTTTVRSTISKFGYSYETILVNQVNLNGLQAIELLQDCSSPNLSVRVSKSMITTQLANSVIALHEPHKHGILDQYPDKLLSRSLKLLVLLFILSEGELMTCQADAIKMLALNERFAADSSMAGE